MEENNTINSNIQKTCDLNSTAQPTCKSKKNLSPTRFKRRRAASRVSRKSRHRRQQHDK